MNRLFVMAILVFVLALGLSACGHLTEDGTGLLFRTADEGLTVGFRLLPPPPPLPTVEPQLLPTITPTPCRTIAGNINAQGQKLWHDETSPQWGQIRIDESKGEKWFCDAASAEAAGWAKAGGN